MTLTIVSTSHRECRRFEKITGLMAVWIEQDGIFTVFEDGTDVITIEDKDPKKACRRALEKNLARLRAERMDQTQGRCERCSRGLPLHFHHIKHRGLGGATRDDRRENLKLLCYICHRKKHG
jgi:hypothetical protein